MAGKRIVTLLREVAAGLRGRGCHGAAADFENSARGCEGGTRFHNNDRQAVDLILSFATDVSELARRQARAATLERAVLIAAPQHQGANGITGHVISEALGIAHPITMDALFDYAEERGMAPMELWPWATQTAEARKK